MPKYVLQNNKKVGKETPKTVQDDILLLQEITEKAKYINPRSRQNPAKTETEKKERTAEYNQLCDIADEVGIRLVRTGWYMYKKKPCVMPNYVLQINKGVGAEAAKSVLYFLNSDIGEEILEKLQKLKIHPVGEVEKKAKLKGKNFVLTGTLPTLKRPEAIELINQNGGKVLSTVTKNASYLLAGDKTGSKFENAKKLGVEIISEQEFLKMIDEL